MSEEVTVILIDKAWRELNAAAELSGLTRTDFLNRAIQIYASLAGNIAAGADILLVFPPEPHPNRLLRRLGVTRTPQVRIANENLAVSS